MASSPNTHRTLKFPWNNSDFNDFLQQKSHWNLSFHSDNVITSTRLIRLSLALWSAVTQKLSQTNLKFKCLERVFVHKFRMWTPQFNPILTVSMFISFLLFRFVIFRVHSACYSHKLLTNACETCGSHLFLWIVISPETKIRVFFNRPF